MKNALHIYIGVAVNKTEHILNTVELPFFSTWLRLIWTILVMLYWAFTIGLVKVRTRNDRCIFVSAAVIDDLARTTRSDPSNLAKPWPPEPD